MWGDAAATLSLMWRMPSDTSSGSSEDALQEHVHKYI
jgi:hypothetical protein